MKQSKKIRNLLKYNLKTLVNFEIAYKLISAIIFIPFFLNLFKQITKLTGYNYLTFENLFSFLLNPLSILLIFLLLMLITFYTILDISTIIIILDYSYQKQKITVKQAFTITCQKSICFFKKQNIALPFFILFLIPFLNLGISSGFISTISIPEFIMDYINHNTLLSILYILVFLSLAFLLFRWLYAIHYFVLENCNFKEARKKSITLSKKHKIKDFLSILFIQFMTTIIYIILILIGILLIILFYKILGKNNLFGNLFITIIWLLIAILFAIMTLLSTPISYASISILYYYHKDQNHEKIIHLKPIKQEFKQTPKKIKILKFIILLFLLWNATLLTNSIINQKYDLKIEYIRTMEVTAHRGASVFYPENTMSAFKGAKQLGADWIELDVQQTKDQKLIILHDTNLKRTTRLNKNTWEITYDDIKDLDAGSFFNKKFKGEKIPLLEEVLQYAKANHIKLNIELKPTGHEQNFEKSVVELIEQYNFSNDCVITSQTYKVLENIKKYNKNIKTVYVMSFAYGDITKLSKADSFSIESSSVTKTLVNKVHASGKELYAWTVNTKDSIQKMIDQNVDNIITDNITLAKETIYSSKTSNLIQEYIKRVNQLLK